MKFLTVLIFFFLSFFAQAQDVSFVVYHSQGQSTRNGKAVALKKGDKLSEADMITVGKGARLILICRNFNAIQLTASGRFHVKSLLQRCEQKAGSYTASYFKYVWEEFTHPHGYPDKDPTKFMRNSGAVSRGCPTVETKLAADTIVYATGNLTIYFNTSLAFSYVSVFSEAENGDVIWQWKTDGKKVLFDSLRSILKQPGTYYWQLTDENAQGCPPNVLTILPMKTYQAALKNILPQNLSLPPAEEAFLKGYLLEEAYFLAEAKKFYDRAVQLEPRNPAYKKAQSRFYE